MPDHNEDLNADSPSRAEEEHTAGLCAGLLDGPAIYLNQAREILAKRKLLLTDSFDVRVVDHVPHVRYMKVRGVDHQLEDPDYLRGYMEAIDLARRGYADRISISLRPFRLSIDEAGTLSEVVCDELDNEGPNETSEIPHSGEQTSDTLASFAEVDDDRPEGSWVDGDDDDYDNEPDESDSDESPIQVPTFQEWRLERYLDILNHLDTHPEENGSEDTDEDQERNVNETPSQSHPEVPRSRLHSLFAMIARTLNRRACILMIGATLGAGILHTIQSSKPANPVVSSTEQQGALRVANDFRDTLADRLPELRNQAWPPIGWVPPTYWDDVDPISRAVFFELDMFVFVQEQIAIPSPAVKSGIAMIMTDPTLIHLRSFVIHYIRDTSKNSYLVDTLWGLQPTSASPIGFRRFVLYMIRLQFRDFGATAIDPLIRPALEFYRDSSMETDSATQKMVANLVELLISGGL